MKRYVKAAFDSSMPSWLKKSLTGGRLNNYRNAVLRDAFIKKGIALDRAQFLDHDPGFGSQPVYLLQTDYGTEVYAPGINDDSTGYFNNRQRKFGSIAKSKLLDMSADVVWINMLDDSNKFSKKDRYQDPRYSYRNNSRGDYAGQYKRARYLGRDEEGNEMYSPEEWSKSGMTPRNESRSRDKSGYKVPSPEQMITRFYEKYPEKLASKVDDVYQEILDARDQISAYDFRELGEDRYSSDVANAYNYLSQSISEYRNMLRSIKDMERYSSKDHEVDKYMLRTISQYITSIRRRLNDAINLLYPGSRA